MSVTHSVLKFVRGAFAGGVVVITLLVMYPLDVLRLRHLSEYAVHVLFVWLLLSMFFLVLRREKMMWTALLAAGVLAIFLRERSTVRLTAAVALADRPSFSVALYNTVNADNLQQAFLQKMTERPVDLLTIQEVDPQWRALLLDSLSATYPFQLEVRDIGIYGMLMLSPHPLEMKDSFWVTNSPVLAGELRIPGTPRPLRLVASYIPPLMGSTTLRQQQAVLDSLGTYCDAVGSPLIALGAFNTVHWSPEMNAFLDLTLLQESRRGLGAFTEDERFDMFDIQRDHILYSNHLNRIDFRAIDYEGTATNRHGGFIGTYQYATPLEDAATSPTEF